MCAFNKTWSEADLGGENASDIDDLIENTRYATRERLAVEHYAYATEGANLDVMLHRKTAARTNYGLAANVPTAPTAVGASGRVDGTRYRETDTGLIKYWDDANEEWVTESSDRHSGITTTYTAGTASFTNGSAVVTGADTEWSGASPGVTAGDVLKGADGEYYGIASVDSDTQVTLDRNYDGDNAAGQTYTIYFDGHPQYLSRAADIETDEIADNAVSVAGTLAAGSSAQSPAPADWTDLDSMSVTLTTSGKTGSFVLIDFVASVNATGSSQLSAHFIVEIDGSTEANSQQFVAPNNYNRVNACVHYLKTGLTAAEHIFKIQWKKNPATSGAALTYRSLRVVEMKR